MQHEIIKKSDMSITKVVNEKSSDELMCEALDNAGATEQYLAEGLVTVADEAYTMTPKGEVYPDYNSRLQALKEMRKIRSNKPETQINIQNVFGQASGNL